MRNSSKRGQITVVIIIVLVLLLAVVLIFMLRPAEEVIRAVEVPAEMQPIYTYVEDCIESSAVNGVYLMGTQGGYIYLPDSYVSAYYSDVAYGYKDGRNTFVTQSEMKTQLERFIIESVPGCVNFSSFPGFEISPGEIKPNVVIGNDEVVFNVNYPISAAREGVEQKVNEFRVAVPIRLGYIHGIMSSIVEKTRADPDWIDLTYLSEFDVLVDIIPHSEKVLIYSITDESASEPFIFLSAFSYIPNLAPVITINDTIMLTDAVPFVMKVNVTDPEGDPFNCLDDTALFDISDDCVILFTPEVPGDFDVKLTAIDVRGNEAEKEVRFSVR